MKRIVLVVLLTAGCILAAFAMMMVASETGEVVTLSIPQGESVSQVRLWVVDVDDVEYLRAGHADAGWFRLLQQSPQVQVERGGVAADYTAVPAPEAAAAVGAEMLAKYGWRERYIALLVGGREGAVPIALVPAG